MTIGKRLKQLRLAKGMSQQDLENKVGLLTCYTSRVENGHTIPTLETLERFAEGLGTPVYLFFYDGEDVPTLANLSKTHTLEEVAAMDHDRSYLEKINQAFRVLSGPERRMVLRIAQQMAASMKGKLAVAKA